LPFERLQGLLVQNLSVLKNCEHIFSDFNTRRVESGEDNHNKLVESRLLHS
jgi:uncharacterized protein YutE (UPF0331/DUF86 family)